MALKRLENRARRRQYVVIRVIIPPMGGILPLLSTQSGEKHAIDRGLLIKLLYNQQYKKVLRFGIRSIFDALEVHFAIDF
jgi:hypothetical protein